MLSNQTVAPLTKSPDRGYNIDERQRVMLIALRRALIQVLGAIEDCLGMERSIESRRRRDG